ncbi:MAG: hypothetical protein IID46_07645 [Planctomycetes bacterium]|nr:hypothetical protein [Planctomycetota bacterium]
MKLQQKYRDKVACMSVSLDYDDFDIKNPEEARKEVLKALKKVDARFENFISGDVDDEFYKITKTTGIPTVLVYDTAGQLHKIVDANSVGGREISYEQDIIPLVDALITEK